MVVAKALFWGSLGALAWTHVGYPLAAGALARVRRRPVARDTASEPTVAVIVAAYNEEAVIERRLENLLALDYPADRLEIVARLPHEEFLEAHQRVDIALDAYPYHGTTTTVFSLWMGLPVVVLAGPAHVSRVGVSLLNNLGMPELVAQTQDEYVQIAKKLASDLAALAALRSDLRRRMLESPLANGQRGARALAGAFRQMWSNWCATKVPFDGGGAAKLPRQLVLPFAASRLTPSIRASRSSTSMPLTTLGSAVSVLASMSSLLA